MKLYYLNIELLSKYKPKLDDEVILISVQRISRVGEPQGNINIFTSWEHGEEGVIRSFYNMFSRASKWDFVPVCNGTYFYERLLNFKLKKYNLPAISFDLSIDFRPIFVMMNRGLFAGSGLSDFVNLEKGLIYKWYTEKRYDKIIDYVENKTNSFLSIYQDVIKILGEYGVNKKRKKV